MRSHVVFFFALIFFVLCGAGRAQTPAPLIVQVAAPAPTVAAKPVAAAQESDTKVTIQLLQEMQATNAATIKKQEAALATLDELEKAAQEIKIFSKRG
jgi:hypothetical protein